MTDYLSQGRSGRQGVGFFVVVAIHIFLIWGLMSGLATKIVSQVTEPFKVEKIDEPPPPPEDTPPPPPPDLVDPPPFVPPPDFQFDAPATTSTNTITQTTQEVRPAGPTVPVRGDPKHPPTRPEYPPSAKRLEQEGVVGLLLYVCEDGRVKEAQVEKSSGFPALDASALREARSYRFLPAQDKGKAVCAWHRINIRFRLEDA